MDAASVADDASHNFEFHGKKHKVSGGVVPFAEIDGDLHGFT